ncbi:sialate O-acetylesterase [Abditibacterium utsteinense]|uniref:Sialate O-acetylesterase n=1 Tax=Abditibacterium utsteinense TaxID=1960156 RepID=A0A2S8SVJ0_9BACT|nr:sialate O-acetylesterase [Abditibacterium utsteinense]PQV64816.1 sialate O-acetylesterase [Abditibacterium utsteinense]
MIKNMIWVALSAALLLEGGSTKVHAQETTDSAARPLLHPLFSENAVLQRDRALPIWGWTQPGANVVVQFDAQKQTTRAGSDGRWTVSVAPHAAGGSHSLSVTGAGGVSVTSKNLLFGDVWLCGGQSNMAYDLYGAKNPEAEIAAANYPNIRLLQEPNAITSAPISSFGNTTWQLCSPQTVAKFSGVGYFFGRKLHQDLKVPIGLINASWSGTPAESWVSGPALSTMPEFRPAVDSLRRSATQGSAAEQMLAWWQNDPGTVAHQEAPNFEDAAWKTLDLPGYWEGKGFPGFDGVMWLRRVVDVPANWAGRDMQLHLGAIDDSDTTYWNGAPAGATNDHQQARNYTIPGAQVKAGRNVIAVRVLDTGGDGGFSGSALSMQSGTDTVSLDGAWRVRQGAALQTLPAMPPRLDDPNAPVVLFNGKIAPLLPGQIKGVIWYQGESNADNAAEAQQYRTLLPLLIRDWRAHFGAQTPFYIVQLANFKAPDEVPSDDAWPQAREAQLQTSQRLPNTPLVVTIDLGEENNVHYPNKQEVGNRLALSALSNTYGLRVESSGPTLRGAKAAGGAMQLSFDHAQGLNLKGDMGRVFAIAGADKKFGWATPQIAGNVVTLRNPAVPAPVYARFGWSNNPRAALYNAAGLPASPFRTDANIKVP